MAESTVTTDVINGCSVLRHTHLQELFTWEIVYLQPSEKLFVEVLSHTKSKNPRPHLLNGYFSALKGIATNLTHL